MKTNQLAEKFDGLSVRIFQNTPVGPILFAAGVSGLVNVTILAEEELPFFSGIDADQASERIVRVAVAQMKEYFIGALKRFSVPLDLKDRTDFQREVLVVTQAISFGSVLTYGDVAERIGRPRSARAVGGALARNPIGIIIPCHRVVAHDGSLHGFSSPNGILAKAALLEHEGVQVVNKKVQL